MKWTCSICGYTYEGDNPPEQCPQCKAPAEKFVKQTAKRSSKYTAEDWQNAVDQFIAMTKNGFEHWSYMTSDEIQSFEAARLKFMETVHVNGSEDVAMQVKAAYGEIFK